MDNSFLFGNGINQLSESNIAWEKLLSTIKGANDFDNGSLPYTMIYERVILEKPDVHEDVLKSEHVVKQEIADLLSEIQVHPYYVEIYNLNFKNYLTTNYDYGFINSVKEKNPKIEIKDHSTEGVYSVRRKKSLLSSPNQYKSLWHIHGEISRPPTIMLGLDHYSGSVGKINNYIKGTYKYNKDGRAIQEISIGDKFDSNSFKETSWLDLFFTTNIHIAGLSLDYSEIDLWWVLNKRARMIQGGRLRKSIKNKVVYYCPCIKPEVHGLLNSLCVEVEIIKVSDTENKKYEVFWDKLLSSLN